MYDYEEEIFLEGYYDAMSDVLIESEKTTYNNGNENEPNFTRYKKVNKNGKVTVEAEAGGNGLLHRLYKNYLAKCKEKNKEPMSYTKWKVTRGAAVLAAAGGTAGAGTGVFIGGRTLYRRHKNKKSKSNN